MCFFDPQFFRLSDFSMQARRLDNPNTCNTILFYAFFIVNQAILLQIDPYHGFSVNVASYHGFCTSLRMLAQVCTSDLISKAT